MALDPNKPPPVALTIAGSDSGGGAGIQADLKAFSALGVYGASVITALTAQNTRTVRGVFPASADFVRLQIDTVFEDIRVDAVKIGMLGDPEITRAVAEGIKAHAPRAVVLDPVMVAKSGDKLLQDEAVDALRSELIPLADIVTPNLPEAAVLTGDAAPDDEAGMEAAGRAILEQGPKVVLVKGGHGHGPVVSDLLVSHEGVSRFTSRRIETTNTHGTGCTLSSAIAAMLAHGRPLEAAIEAARAYLHGAIQQADGLDIGTGHGPVHHFHTLWHESPAA